MREKTQVELPTVHRRDAQKVSVFDCFFSSWECLFKKHAHDLTEQCSSGKSPAKKERRIIMPSCETNSSITSIWINCPEADETRHDKCGVFQNRTTIGFKWE